MPAPESLFPIWWIAINPSKPSEPRRFEAVTYVEARSMAAKWFRQPETVIRVRALFEYEVAALRVGRAA